MARKHFTVDVDGYALAGDTISSGGTSDLLFLHGAGTSQRNRFDPMREALAREGLGSIAFDFAGCGESSGDVAAASLKDRVEQAAAVIRELKMPAPVSLIGSSMGGYVAVKLTELFPVKNLVLFVPAMYTDKAYEAPFGNGFTELIREEGSWQHSDAWEILERFEGNLLVIAAEHDEVVPRAVIDRIEASATRAKSKEIFVVSGARHGIGDHFAAHPEVFVAVVQKLAALCKP